MSIIDEERVSNDSGNEHFRDILDARLSVVCHKYPDPDAVMP